MVESREVSEDRATGNIAEQAVAINSAAGRHEPANSVVLDGGLIEPGQVDLTRYERFVLDYFLKIACFNSAVRLDDEFWLVLARRFSVSHQSPAIRHAAIAFGASLFKLEFRPNNCDSIIDRSEETNRFVLEQSNKSIAHLLEAPRPSDLTSKRAHKEAVMVTCTLLASVALAHNDLPAAQTHLQFGLRAMEEWRSADFDNSAVGPIVYQALADHVPRLQACSNFVSFLKEENPCGIPLPATFTGATFQYAIDRFGIYWAWLISQKSMHGFSMGSIIDSYTPLHSLELSVMFKVQRWRKLVNYFIRSNRFLVSQAWYDRLYFLQLWREVFLIKAGAAAAADQDPFHKPFQMRYDGLWTHFKQANEWANRLLQSPDHENVIGSTSHIGTAVAIALFYCGFCCRDWVIRRETLRTLKAWEHKYMAADSAGSSASSAMHLALERVIEIESEGLRPLDVVPQSDRIHYVRVIARPGSSEMRLTYFRSGMARIVVIPRWYTE